MYRDVSVRYVVYRDVSVRYVVCRDVSVRYVVYRDVSVRYVVHRNVSVRSVVYRDVYVSYHLSNYDFDVHVVDTDVSLQFPMYHSLSFPPFVCLPSICLYI